jgi:hypothetical protein
VAASAKESSFNMERLDIKSGLCATTRHKKPKEKAPPLSPDHLLYLQPRRNYSRRFIPSNAAVL